MPKVRCHALNCVHNGEERFECPKTDEEMGFCNCPEDIELIDHDSEAFYCIQFSMKFTDEPVVSKPTTVIDFDVNWSVFDKGDYNTVVGTITKIDHKNDIIEFERNCDRKIITIELKRLVELYDILPF